MAAEEAALYEAFVVKVDHVSAYLLDGPFAWPSSEELAAEAAVLQQLQQQQQAPGAGAGAMSALQVLLARRARMVPLLDRFGVGMDLQVATSVHPRCDAPVSSLRLAACTCSPAHARRCWRLAPAVCAVQC